MAWPDIIKDRDSRRVISYTIQPYIISGNSAATIKAVPGIPIQKTNTGNLLGNLETFWGGRTSKFTPGVFRIGHVRQFRSSRACSNTTCTVYGTYYGVQIPTIGFSGPMGAFAAPASYGGWTYLTPDLVADVNIALSAYARANEGAAQALVTLGELPETMGMILRPMNNLPKLLRKLKRPRTSPSKGGNSAKAAVSYATSKWLELRYGILPLLGEIDTYRNVYNSKLTVDLGPIRKARAGDTSAGSSIPATKFVTKATIGTFYLHGYYSVDRSTIATCTAYSQNQWTAAQNLGIDASSIIPALYELVPYSFVLDWVYDVGTWLRAKIPKPGVNHLGSCYSTKVSETYTVSVTHSSAYQTLSATHPASPCNSELKWSRDTYNRTNPPVLPATPVFKINMDPLVRQIDAVSLAWQRVANENPKNLKRG